MRIALLFLLATSALAQEISSPARPGAAQPHLEAAPNGDLVMSWVEPGTREGDHALRVAAWRNGKWSPPRTIVERSDLFVNWADFPSVAVDASGTYFAHWLQKSGKGTYAYHVHITASRDGGKSWSKPRRLHSDASNTEHGFVSLSPLPRGGVGAVWLDGHAMPEEGKGSMQLRYAEIDPAGRISPESLLDPRVCECCTTGMTMAQGRPVVVYRDRSEGEVRDIGTVRRTGSSWSAPRLVRGDGWKIDGCPVNGPQIDARGKNVASAWYTGADATGRVFAAFSSDAGATFPRAVRVDDGKPVGRVDVALASDGSALVVWIEGMGDAAQIVARRVRPDGALGAIVKVGGTTAARAAGFPRMAMTGDSVYVAWTEPTTPKRIRIAKIRP